jgi:hypothetical protein
MMRAGTGIIRKIGWMEDEYGGQVFQAIVEFPDGPPDSISFQNVWQKAPVTIVVVRDPMEQP